MVKCVVKQSKTSIKIGDKKEKEKREKRSQELTGLTLLT